MTVLFVICCRKYENSKDFEKDNKDFVNRVDKIKVSYLNNSF